MIGKMLEFVLRGWAKELAINPRKISLRLCLRDDDRKWQVNELAVINAVAVAESLRQPAEARLLEVRLGDKTKLRVNLGRKR